MTIRRKPAGGSGEPGWDPSTQRDGEPGAVAEAKRMYRDIGQTLDVSVRIFVAAMAFMEMKELEQEFTDFCREHFDVDPEEMK